jgi:membrane-associated phospholipid phosphatase
MCSPSTGLRKGLLGLLTCLFSALAWAQTELPAELAPEVEKRPLHLHPVSRDYLVSYLADGRELLLAPWHFDRRQRRNTAFVLGGIGLAMWLDADVKTALMLKEPPHAWAGYTDPLGNGMLLIPLSGVLWLEARLRGNEHGQLTGLNLAKAGIGARILVQLPKYMFQRHRPGDSPANPFIFEGPFGNYRNNSFPSGHVTTAFATAAVMRQAYGAEHPWVPVLFYGLGAASAAGRLYQNKHWLSDVLLAAIIGQWVGDFVSLKGSTRFELNGAGVAYKL